MVQVIIAAVAAMDAATVMGIFTAMDAVITIGIINVTILMVDI